MIYIESAADHDFTAFLAGVTPAKARRDLSANLAEIEKRRMLYLVAKSISDRDADKQQEIHLAIRMARAMRETTQKAS